MNLCAIDIETALVCYENPTPAPICMSWARGEKSNVNLVTEESVRDLTKGLLNEDTHLVGQYIAFDLSLLCYEYPILWSAVYQAYDEGRIHDTGLRERLLMLTINGDFNVFYGENHHNTKIDGYSLVNLEKKYLGIDRSDQKDNPDAWRFRYEELTDTPVEDWPKEAYDYSLADSVNCLAVFHKQEIERKNCINRSGIDPFKVEDARVRYDFALRLLECKGERTDPKKILEVTKLYMDMYNDPELVDPLTQAGLLVPASPPVPYAKGTKAHKETCIFNSKHAEYKAGRKANCDCPPKMKGGTKEKMPTKVLHQYIWTLAYQNVDGIDAWPAPKANPKASELDGRKFSQVFIDSTNGVLPEKFGLTCNEEWSTVYSDKDPVLKKLAARKTLQKIVTDYLPKFYYEDENGEKKPTEVLRGSFHSLKKTGRSSCSASDWYPSSNRQNVDPRVRPCSIPREGNVFVSTDISGMELATLAQKCYELFGASVLRDKINRGDDVHAYLGSQIAVALDPGFAVALSNKKVDVLDRESIFQAFMKTKGCDLPCEKSCAITCDAIKKQYRAEHDELFGRDATWGDLYKFYRRLAKPTGLGFPGGLGPPTMVVYAKGTYKVDMTEDVARRLRQIWLETYPEMEQYLLWIKNHCRDEYHVAQYGKDDEGRKHLETFYCYDTPLGLHRARCSFCAAANGAALQAPSAEGALDGLYQTGKHMILSDDPTGYHILQGCYPVNFIHDEILWECPDDEHIDERIGLVDAFMVTAMERVTPDVKARTESCVMRRWYKEAEPVFVDGKIIPWEPKE